MKTYEATPHRSARDEVETIKAENARLQQLPLELAADLLDRLVSREPPPPSPLPRHEAAAGTLFH